MLEEQKIPVPVLPLIASHEAPGAHRDADALSDRLRQRVSGEVRFDAGSRALYATDASNYRQVPVGVVLPRSAEDIIATVATCREFGVPVFPRGTGTSLAGQTCNSAVVIDCSKHYNRILQIDPQARRAAVEPGVILDHLRDAAEHYQLTFGPDPSTHRWCTLGGMIGNNSCGVHSVMAGMTAQNVDQLDVLTYDGLRLTVGKTSDDEYERIARAGGRQAEIYRRLRSLRDRYADEIRRRFPAIERRASGYNLPALLPEHGFNVAQALVGSEGTCVTVLQARVCLVHSPPKRVLLVLGYPDVYEAGDHVPEIRQHQPIGLEGIDDRLIEYMRRRGMHPRDIALLPAGCGWLLVEFGAVTLEEAIDQAHRTMDALRRQDQPPSMELIERPEDQEKLWKVREAGLGATAHVPGMVDTWPGWEDSSVRVDQLGHYLRALRTLFDKYGYHPSLYGHFGQACVHCRVDFDLLTAGGVRSFRSFLDEAADLVVRYGGSLSGEHGDGQARAELLPKMFGAELVEAFEEFKAIWDPEGRMNPGKIIRPNPITGNLRLGTEYDPPRLETHFSFFENGGSFAAATRQCVGVGECRRTEGGTMCPSFRVTREEQHTTRGRARLLFEMLEGDPIDRGWRSEAVEQALDICLACKGCKGDCPVSVDMATYKAEFLSHYYAGRLRPRSAYAFGLIFYWARLAAWAPCVVNFLTQTPGLRGIAKQIAGVAPQRSIPRFANETFVAQFRRRPTRRTEGTTVMLWPDTFNNHFHPDTAMAAVEVLEAAGFQVEIPETWLCCGRPVYDFGMLDLGKRLLCRTLDELRPQIRAGVPIVGLEPSCVSVFRDELLNLFPHDEDALRLSRQTFLLGELLQRYAPDFQIPRLERQAVVHGHCHHKAIMRMDAEEAVLRRAGLDYEILDSGCCGMAGAFGFEKEHYNVSVAAGEEVLLPAVRRAGPDTLIVADGFSCREQIRQQTNREALHLSEVLQLAIRQEPDGRPSGRGAETAGSATPLRAAALAGAGAAALVLALIWRSRRNGI